MSFIRSLSKTVQTFTPHIPFPSFLFPFKTLLQAGGSVWGGCGGSRVRSVGTETPRRPEPPVRG